MNDKLYNDREPVLVGKLGDDFGCPDVPFPGISDCITFDSRTKEICEAVREKLDGICIKVDGKRLGRQ